jgi:hypothetical protein
MLKAQVEFDMGEHRLVLSTTPHRNYTLFHFDPSSQSILYDTLAKTVTMTGIR